MRAFVPLVVLTFAACVVDTKIDDADRLSCSSDADCPDDRTCVELHCLTPAQLATPAVAFVEEPVFAPGENVRSDHAGKNEFHVALKLNADADVSAASDVGDVACARDDLAQYTCSGTVVNETAEGIHAVTVVAKDGVGRTAERQLALEVDKTAPAASIINTTIARDGEPREAAGDGSVVSLTIALDEDAADVVVAGAPPGSEPFTSTVNGRLVTALLDVDAAATFAGSRAVRITTTDAVDNTATVDVPDVFTVDFDAPLAAGADLVVLTRAPWGQDGGAPFTRVDGVAGAVEPGAGLVFSSDAAGLGRLDVATSAADGSFSEVLPVGDVSVLFVTVVDAAGNASPTAQVKHGVWIVTPARPAGSPANPMTVQVAPRFAANLVDDSMVAVDASASAAAVDGATLDARTAGDWRERTFLPGPPARERAAVASDAARGVVVLFGGDDGGVPLDDTWTFDGENWSERVLAVHPPARDDAAMVYDANDDVTVLFGGEANGAPLGDVWLFDGERWTPVDVGTPAPAALSGARFAFTAAGPVLFGGRGEDGAVVGETWLFDARAARFTLVDGAGPDARARMAMSTDARTSRAVLFGGENTAGAPFGDTWIFDGAAWTPTATAGASPDAQSEGALAFDAKAGRLVLVETQSASAAAAVFQLSADLTTWAPASTTAVAARTGAAAASAGDAVVLFGGRDQAQRTLDETVVLRDDFTTLTTLEPPDLVNPSAAFDAPNHRALVVGIDAGRRTWSYDGLTWSEVAVDAGGAGALASDAALTVVQVDPLGGVERFSSGSWQRVLDPGQIGLGGSLAAAFDGAHVVGVGNAVGFIDDALGAGALWQTSGTDPGGRSDAAVTFAGPSGASPVSPSSTGPAALLFGGGASGCTDGLCDDTWIFDGAQWTQAAPAEPPPGREKHALAYDADRDEVIVFGGNGAAGSLADTWAFREGQWRPLTPAHAPPARFNASMTSSSTVTGAASRLLLFGGVVGVAQTHDLWEWRGGGGDRAAVIMRVPFTASNAGAGTLVQTSARVVAAGHGGASDGAELLAWVPGTWSAQQSNASATPGELALTDADALPLGTDRTVSFAVTETNASGPFGAQADVDVDYIEFSFAYVLP